MSIRFEVLKNGQRVCMSGINGDGVLSAMVNYVQHEDHDPHFGLRIGGLGKYAASTNREHVNWPSSDIEIGDEITIRILPAGEFESPEEAKPYPELTLDDPDFGKMTYTSGSWNSDIEFVSGPIQTAHVHIHAYDNGPTDAQRDLFRELATEHARLWPQICEVLVRCHLEIETSQELAERLKPHVGIELDIQSKTIYLLYKLSDEPETIAYSVALRNWAIVEICTLE